MSKQRENFISRLIFASLIFGMGALLTLNTSPALAQTPKGTRTPTFTPTPLPSWSNPNLIFTGAGPIFTPLLLSDRTGGVHLLWKVIEPAKELGQPGDQVLFYSKLEGSQWSPPVDILVSKILDHPSAAVDSKGMLHLIWSGESQQIYYSRVPVDQAGKPKSWSKPETFGRANQSAQLVVDAGDRLHIVFPGVDSRGVYYLTSPDGGDHWSAPVNIATTARLDTSAEYIRLAVSPNGTLHVVWTEFQLPSAWPPAGIYYAQSTDAGEHWSNPQFIAGPNYDQANIVAVNDQEIHILWNAIISIGGRYHRWSADSGKTWSETDRMAKEGGTEGTPQMLVDAKGKIHVLSTYNKCPQYQTWLDNQWSPAVCLTDQPILVSSATWTGYIEEPALTLSAGNMLHAVFWDNRQQLWYANLTIKEVAETAPQPFTTPLPPTPTARSLSRTTPTETDTPVPQQIRQGQISTPNPLQSLAVDLLPSLLLVGGVGLILCIRLVRRR